MSCLWRQVNIFVEETINVSAPQTHEKNWSVAVRGRSGLGRVGLDWVGLGRFVSGWVRLGLVGFDWFRLARVWVG